VVLLAVGKSATAQEALPAGWLESRANERGQKCEKHAVQPVEAGLLLACGAAGVWEVALSEAGPRFVKSYEFSGDVVGFFKEADGALWVKLRVLEARPFSPGASAPAVRFPEDTAGLMEPEAAPAAVAPPTPPPSPKAVPSARPPTGRVVRTAPGEVVISLGVSDGVERGDRIELALERVQHEPGDAAGEEAELSREPLAVGVVTNVSEHSAKVRLGLNESVPLDAVALPTRASPTAGLIAPPRVTGIWNVELMARPFAAVGELGGGMLLSGTFARRFDGNLQLRAVVDPFALADVESRDSVTAFNLSLLASYDSQFFEMGAGFGGQSVNETLSVVKPGTGWSVAQFLRLGAQDGLNLTVRSSVVLFHSEFEFGGMVASTQIPITRGYWLLFGGGGGNVGYGYGELGLRVLLSGNGQAGSRFLTVSAGGAGVFRSAICEAFFPCEEAALSYGGPMAGIGSEWRF
jgi:hypothetical protein